MRKPVIFLLLFCFLISPCAAQSVNVQKFAALAKVVVANGPTYLFGAEVSWNYPNLADGWTVILTSEMDHVWFPNLSPSEPAQIRITPQSNPLIYEGIFLRQTGGNIVITTGLFTATIVPVDYDVRSLLAGQPLSYVARGVRLTSDYPAECNGTRAFFGSQVPCQADGALIVF